MRRDVSARFALQSEGEAELIFAIAVAASYRPLHQSFEVIRDGRPLAWHEIEDAHGTRLHLVKVDAGPIEVAYSATVDAPAQPLAEHPAEDYRYLRPSRYCESDSLAPTALAEFAGLQGAELLAAVASWVGVRLSYVPGSSLPTDGAVRTLLQRSGVCRDYAHLVVAFLRALDVPARVVSAYAPGLSPMDFHAVAEAKIDGRWRVVDATALAPRSALVRIASGRDAADTAFLSVSGAPVQLLELAVGAVAEQLPGDDLSELVSIG